MGEPAVELTGVAEATEEMHGIGKQALAWVRTSEERVTAAESRLRDAEAKADRVGAELRQRAKATLGRIAEEGRAQLAAERQKRRDAEERAKRAEAARDRSEQAFERARRAVESERETLTSKIVAGKAEYERALAEATKRVEAEASARVEEVLKNTQAEADRRVAAAEQRAAEAESAAAEANRIAVRLEAEIEERVMQGTVDVRREAEERVRKLVAKVEGEAEEHARVRAEEQLRAESDRIRKQAEQREERLRRSAEDEIKASAKRARREVLAVADETAPDWARREATGSGAGYRTF
jgi:hypothetical protein